VAYTSQEAYLLGPLDRKDKQHETGHCGGGVVTLYKERKAENTPTTKHSNTT
jgi:hypothetical protein